MDYVFLILYHLNIIIIIIFIFLYRNLKLKQGCQRHRSESEPIDLAITKPEPEQINNLHLQRKLDKIRTYEENSNERSSLQSSKKLYQPIWEQSK